MPDPLSTLLGQNGSTEVEVTSEDHCGLTDEGDVVSILTVSWVGDGPRELPALSVT